MQASELKTQIESAFKSIGRDLDNLEKAHPDYLAEDPVWERLTKLLNGKVGDDFSKEALDKLYKEGKRRFEESIPPGYMDLKSKKNEGDRSLYGDFLVWKQVIEKGKNIEVSVILVTDDLKDDWWYKFQGKTISPRPELIKEFKEETKKRINIYQADRFLELANVNLQQKTNKEAIEEIRKVRLADEREISERRLMEVFLEDNGDENYKENAKSLVPNDETPFEKAIRTTSENINKE